MTDRVPLDHLTSNQYDQLCNDLDQARAELARVRALHGKWKLTEDSPNTYCAHCEKSGGLYRYPCPTLTALDEL